MTLRDWLDETGAHSQRYGRPDSTAVQVFYKPTHRTPDWRLYRLDDYLLSSHVSGPSVVLIPR